MVLCIPFLACSTRRVIRRRVGSLESFFVFFFSTGLHGMEPLWCSHPVYACVDGRLERSGRCPVAYFLLSKVVVCICGWLVIIKVVSHLPG